MNVNSLYQFLFTLVEPLKASGATEQTLADLRRMLASLQVFDSHSLDEFAAFLENAREYEREGHWPAAVPGIVGNVIDAPETSAYADRLRAFLAKQVPATGPVPQVVLDEMAALGKAFKLVQWKEIARACGLDSRPSSTDKAIEQIFCKLTGREWADVVAEAYASRLQDSDAAGDVIKEIEATLSFAQLKSLAKRCGVGGAARSKADAISKICAAIAAAPAIPTIGSDEPPGIDRGKVDRIVETLNALREKAEPEGAPFEEIEGELRALESGMTREEAVLAAKEFGVTRSVSSRAEAVEQIRERVFRMRRARESIQY